MKQPVKSSWILWRRQFAAVFRLEVKKTFFARRGLWIYFLAFAPILLFGGHSLVEIRKQRACDFGQDNLIFAAVFQFFYLRLAVFFGCVGIFMNLFRGELIEKSLHYYFLAPIRREVLLIGKYLAGLLTAILIFTTGVALSLVALYWHFDSTAVQTYLFNGHGIENIAAYLGVTVLACLGYGSIFLGTGLLFRNPMIPALVVLVWESLNVFLPSALKKISMIYYLKSLCPIDAPAVGPFAIFAVNINPAPASVAIFGILILTLVVMAIASRQVRRIEINYGTE